MATNPLDLITQEPAQELNPGLFDGQLVEQPTPPGQVEQGPIPEVQVAGWGKAIEGILGVREIIKKHELKQSGKKDEDKVPYTRPEPKTATGKTKADPVKIKDEDIGEGGSDPVIDEDTVSPLPKEATDEPELIEVDPVKIKETLGEYKKFTTDTPFSALEDFNPSNLTNEQDVLAVIAAHSEKYRANITDATGGVIAQSATRQMADYLGMSPAKLQDLIAGSGIIKSDKPGDLAASMLAARDLLIASARESDRLAKLVADGDAQALADAGFETFQEADIALQRQWALHGAIQTKVKGAQTEIARALASFNISAAGDELKNMAMRDVLNASESSVSIQEKARIYLELQDPTQRSRYIQDKDNGWAAKTGRAFYESFVNLLLSGPQTHVVNLIGNLLFSLGQIPTRTMAAMMGHIRREGLNPLWEQTSERGVMLGDDAAAALGYFMASIEAGRLSWKAFKDPTGEIVSKLEPGKKFRQNAFSAEGFQARGMMGHLADYMGHIMTLGRIPTRGLVMGDVLFKVMARRSNLYAQAFKKASEEGITDTAEFAESVAHYISNPTKKMLEEGVDEARFVTFQSQLGPLASNVMGFAQDPIVRWFLPFVRTPANIISRAWDHTPFAPFTQRYKDDILAGGEKADMARARVATGTMFAGAVAMAAKSGYITGGGPSDPKLRANLTRQKWQPYSIKLYGTYVQLSRLEPYGTILGLTADLIDLTQRGEVGKVEEAAAALGIAFSKNVTSKTWMEGLNNLLTAVENPDRYGASTIEKFVRTIVPRGVASVEKVLDPEKRYTRDLIDAIKQDVPGWSDVLPAELNLWGEPVVYESNALSLINPFFTSKWKPNDLDTELDRLKIGLSLPSEIIPETGGQVLFDPFEYHDFAEIAGKTAKSKMTEFIKSSKYQDANDLIKEMYINKIWNISKAYAFSEILKHPKWGEDVKNKITTWREQRHKDLTQ